MASETNVNQSARHQQLLARLPPDEQEAFGQFSLEGLEAVMEALAKRDARADAEAEARAAAEAAARAAAEAGSKKRDTSTATMFVKSFCRPAIGLNPHADTTVPRIDVDESVCRGTEQAVQQWFCDNVVLKHDTLVNCSPDPNRHGERPILRVQGQELHELKLLLSQKKVPTDAKCLNGSGTPDAVVVKQQHAASWNAYCASSSAADETVTCPLPHATQIEMQVELKARSKKNKTGNFVAGPPPPDGYAALLAKDLYPYGSLYCAATGKPQAWLLAFYPVQATLALYDAREQILFYEQCTLGQAIAFINTRGYERDVRVSELSVSEPIKKLKVVPELDEHMEGQSDSE